MKKCSLCGKTYADDQTFCPDCGYALMDENDTAKTAVPAPESADASASVSAKPAQNDFFMKLFSKCWLLLVSILGYAVSWMPDGDMCVIGTIICCGCAVAAWIKIDGQKLCRNIAVSIISTVIGIVALCEFFVYMI